MADVDLSKLSDEQLEAYHSLLSNPAGAPPPGLSKGTSSPGFIDNLAESGGRVIGGMANAALHPIETAKNIGTAIAGTSPVPGPPGSWHADVAKPAANAVGDFYKKRYGSVDAIKNTAYTDPLGMAADVSAVAAPFEGAARGGAALADVAGATRTSNALRTGANIADAVKTATNPVAAVGAGVGWGAGKAIGALTGVRNGLSPLESAAVDYAMSDPDLKHTVDVGTATGNKAIGAQKSILRKFPTSAGVMADAEEAQKAAIRAKMGDVAENVDPGGPQHIFTSGQNTLTGIKKQLNDYGAKAKDAFENRLFGAAAANPVNVQVGTKPGVPIPNPAAVYDPSAPATLPGPVVPVFDMVAGPTDMAGVKAAAQPLLDQLKQQMQATRTQISPVTSMLEDIVNGPDVVSLRTAKGNISTIQDLARNEAGVMRKKAQALSSQLVGPFHNAIDDAAQKVGPGAYQALQDGNDATKAKYDLAKAVPGSYLKKDVPPADLAQLHDLLTKNEDAQFPALQKVQTHVPGVVPGMARATLEDIFRGTTENGGVNKVQSAINKWNALGPQTKQLLFGPDTTTEIDNLLRYSLMAGTEANTSGTAPTAAIAGLGAMLFHNPVAAVAAMVGARGLAKGIMSPEMAEAVRATGRVPLPSPGRAVKAAAAPFTSPSYLNAGRIANDSVAQRMGRAISQGQEQQQ